MQRRTFEAALRVVARLTAGGHNRAVMEDPRHLEALGGKLSWVCEWRAISSNAALVILFPRGFHAILSAFAEVQKRWKLCEVQTWGWDLFTSIWEIAVVPSLSKWKNVRYDGLGHVRRIRYKILLRKPKIRSSLKPSGCPGKHEGRERRASHIWENKEVIQEEVLDATLVTFDADGPSEAPWPAVWMTAMPPCYPKFQMPLQGRKVWRFPVWRFPELSIMDLGVSKWMLTTVTSLKYGAGEFLESHWWTLSSQLSSHA